MELECKRPDGYSISTDRARLDLRWLHSTLSERAYWALGRSLETVQASIEHSLCFGVYAAGRQVGFARVVTDYATFGWLCDVYVDEAYRSRGLGKWLIETIVSHPDLLALKFIILATRDAHELYRRYGGFSELTNPERWMVRRFVLPAGTTGPPGDGSLDRASGR